MEHCCKRSLISVPPSKLCLNQLCPFQSPLPWPSHCGALEDLPVVPFCLLSGKARWTRKVMSMLVPAALMAITPRVCTA